MLHSQKLEQVENARAACRTAVQLRLAYPAEFKVYPCCAAGNGGSIPFTIKHILCNLDLVVELLSPWQKEKHESEGSCGETATCVILGVQHAGRVRKYSMFEHQCLSANLGISRYRRIATWLGFVVFVALNWTGLDWTGRTGSARPPSKLYIAISNLSMCGLSVILG